MRPLRLTVIVVLSLAAFVVACAIGFAVYLWFFGPSLCGNQQLAVVQSPDGRLKAVVFERDCGATTGFSTQVSVLPVHDALPDENGNVFVAVDDHGAAPAGPGGGPVVSVQWRSPTRLLVWHDRGVRAVVARNPPAGIVLEAGESPRP